MHSLFSRIVLDLLPWMIKNGGLKRSYVSQLIWIFVVAYFTVGAILGESCSKTRIIVHKLFWFSSMHLILHTFKIPRHIFNARFHHRGREFHFLLISRNYKHLILILVFLYLVVGVILAIITLMFWPQYAPFHFFTCISWILASILRLKPYSVIHFGDKRSACLRGYRHSHSRLDVILS